MIGLNTFASQLTYTRPFVNPKKNKSRSTINHNTTKINTNNKKKNQSTTLSLCRIVATANVHKYRVPACATVPPSRSLSLHDTVDESTGNIDCTFIESL